MASVACCTTGLGTSVAAICCKPVNVRASMLTLEQTTAEPAPSKSLVPRRRRYCLDGWQACYVWTAGIRSPL
jgi:hypothetical protein